MKTWCCHIKWGWMPLKRFWYIEGGNGKWMPVPRSWDICPIRGCHAERPTRKRSLDDHGKWLHKQLKALNKFEAASKKVNLKVGQRYLRHEPNE